LAISKFGAYAPILYTNRMGRGNNGSTGSAGNPRQRRRRNSRVVRRSLSSGQLNAEEVKRRVAGWAESQPASIQQELLAIGEIVSDLLAAFEDTHRTKAREAAKRLHSFKPNPLSPNWLLPADQVIHKSNGRSYDSSGGNVYQKIIRALIDHRYGERAPLLLAGYGCSALDLRSFKPFPPDATIITRANSRKVISLNSEIIDDLKKKRCAPLGTEAFQGYFAEKLSLLRATPQEEKPWSIRVDLALRAAPNEFLEATQEGVELWEIKGGGGLDSTKLPGEIGKLIKAALAYGYDDTRLCLCFLEASDQKPLDAYIDTSVRSRVVKNPDQILEALLPEGVTKTEFEQIMAFAKKQFIFDLET